MRAFVVCLLVGSLTLTAHAQPGQTSPGQVPPPYAYQPPPVMITAEEQELLADGEISDAQHAGGVAAAVFLGFGIGQAIEGRWNDTGYLFALGEGSASAFALYGAVRILRDCGFRSHGCERDSDSTGPEWLLAGVVGVSVFRIWGIIDAAHGPSAHNRRVRELRRRVGYQPSYARVVPYLTPSHEGGGMAGLALTF